MAERRNAHSSGVTVATQAQRRVAPFMAAGVLSLLVGMWAGLARIGWQLPEADGELMLRHGGLMVVGFVGTVIAVERAVAVRSMPAFAAPALSAMCGIALIVGAPVVWPPALAASAGAIYALNMATLLIRHRTLPFAVMLVGSVFLTIGGIVWWHGGSLAAVVPWWIAFLALTIAAERLELLRFQRFTLAGAVLGIAAAALIGIGPPVSWFDRASGARLLGVGLIAAAAWLLQRDGARRTVRTDGLARFIAVGLLVGYAWMATTGVLLVAWGLSGAGLQYDAVVHAFFIGFVFNAIIAHEPIIAPSVTGLRFRYTPMLYAPLVLLDGALVTRVWADVALDVGVRRWAGLVQVLAILLFLALAVYSVISARIEDRRTSSQPA